ncbi:hypothetical protein HUW62_19425 [Myxococcus sp. AM011]|uniref:hypothetical protein n=1 Tax=Myxococcus sp. AM011 TaxID=2745200 RepID=UPI00159630E4|nr:hypothetical protein [Myxococcus sp. AM011]NVJ23399.1 hypothetical protein [Myxococcus sp. AM011]
MLLSVLGEAPHGEARAFPGQRVPLTLFQTMSEEDAEALVERPAGVALPKALEGYTHSLIAELAPPLPMVREAPA